MSPVVCPNGHTSQATDYCDTCGEPIAAAAPASGPEPSSTPGGADGGAATGAAGPVACPNCGFTAAAGALFCENCGYDFTTGAPPEPASSLDLGALDLGTPSSAPAATAGAGSGDPGTGGVPGAGGDPTGEGSGGDPVGGEPVVVDPPGAGEAESAGDPGAEPGGGADSGSPAGEPAESAGGAMPAGGASSGLSTGADTWVVEVWVDPDWYAAQQPEDPMPSAGLPGVVVLRERSVLVGRPSVSRGIHPQVDCGADTGVSRRHCQLTTDGLRWWVEDLQSANGTYVSPAGGAVPTEPLASGRRHELEDGDRVYLGAWTRLVVRRALPGEA